MPSTTTVLSDSAIIVFSQVAFIFLLELDRHILTRSETSRTRRNNEPDTNCESSDEAIPQRLPTIRLSRQNVYRQKNPLSNPDSWRYKARNPERARTQYPSVPIRCRRVPQPPNGCSRRMRSHGRRRPRGKIKIAMAPGRRRFAPRISTLPTIRTGKSSAVKFRLPRQPFATPAREGASFGEANVYRPTRHFRQRQIIEHRPVKPLAVALQPTIRMSLVFKLLPFPVFRLPEARIIVVARRDEFQIFAVGHGEIIDIECGNVNGFGGELVVPAKVDFAEARAQPGFPCGNMNRSRSRRGMKRITRRPAGRCFFPRGNSCIMYRSVSWCMYSCSSTMSNTRPPCAIKSLQNPRGTASRDSKIAPRT